MLLRPVLFLRGLGGTRKIKHMNKLEVIKQPKEELQENLQMRHNNVKPTMKQKKTLEILKENPGISLRQAMQRGGYAKITSTRPKQNFKALKGTIIAIEEWRDKLRGIGVTDDLLAQKHLEWLTAEKTITSLTEPDKQVPDYTTQIKAGEMIRTDMGIANKIQDQGKLKKRIVAEEFFEV